MVNFTMLVHNRLTLTSQSLESLKASGLRGLNILLYDDASENETSEYLMEWAERDNACVRGVLESSGTGRARNAAIEHSQTCFGRGDYLYLSDNDVFFYPDWLENLILSYEVAWHAEFRVLGAYNHPFHQPVASLPVGAGFEVKQVGALALQSMLMTWEVWDQYGPFCATPAGKVCQSEDVDFARKLTADGFKLGVVSPALVVNTGITNSFGEKIPGWELVKKECPQGVICE